MGLRMQCYDIAPPMSSHHTPMSWHHKGTTASFSLPYRIFNAFVYVAAVLMHMSPGYSICQLSLTMLRYQPTRHSNIKSNIATDLIDIVHWSICTIIHWRPLNPNVVWAAITWHNNQSSWIYNIHNTTIPKKNSNVITLAKT